MAWIIGSVKSDVLTPPSCIEPSDEALFDTEAHFALLEDIESSDEALFPSTESIDQSQSAVTPFDPLLENIEPSDEAPFPSAATQFYPLLEDSALSELFDTEAHFALLEDIESSETSAEAFSMKETETFDLLDDFFNNISSWEVFQILCNFVNTSH